MLRDLAFLLHVPAFLAVLVLPVAAATGPSPVVWSLLATAGLGVGLGQALRCCRWQPTVDERARLSITVALGWLAITVLGAVPFWISGMATTPAANATLAHFADPITAWFEGASGFTGTGLTMCERPSELPAGLQLWRSASEWIGSGGVILIALALVHRFENDHAAYQAETRNETLMPNLSATARRIWLLYLSYTLAVIVALRLGGLDWWVAFNHGLTAMSTGGFTVTDEGFAGTPVAVRWIGFAALILGAISFDDHDDFWRGRWGRLVRSGQLLALLALIALGGGVLVAMGYPPLEAWFQFASAQTTAGHATVEVANWVGGGLAILIVAMIVGGASGSTAGGIKLRRVLFLGKMLLCRFRGRQCDQATLRRFHAVRVFVAAWLVTLLVGTLVVGTASGWEHDVRSVIFDVTSGLSNVGLSTGVVGPDLHWSGRLAVGVLMILGRLEILPFGVVVAAVFGDVRAERQLGREVEED